MAICTNVAKLCITLVNLVFWAAGIVLVFLGTWIFEKYVKHGHSMLRIDTALLPAVILIVVGILAVLVGIIGCIAAFKEQKCVTGLFFSLILIILMGLIAGVVLSVLYRSQIDNDVKHILESSLQDYDENNDTRATVDAKQSEFQCCGVENYTDWLDTPWYRNGSEPRKEFPKSCCKNESCTSFTAEDKQLNKRGCYSLIKEEFIHHLVISGAVAGSFALLLIIAMICSCVLIASRRRNQTYYSNLTDDGMHV